VGKGDEYLVVKAEFVDKINELNKLKSQHSLKKYSEIPGLKSRLLHDNSSFKTLD
jgi:hypothetical protein